MKKQSVILAGSIAVALALAGGTYSPHIASAASNSSDQEQTQPQEMRQESVQAFSKKSHAVLGKGSFGGARDEGKEGSHRGIYGNVEDLSEMLGLTENELKKALKSGTSLAAVAEKQGVDVNKIINLLVKAETERLQEQLSAGKITQDKYDAPIAELVERVTERVNGDFPSKPERKTQSEE